METENAIQIENLSYLYKGDWSLAKTPALTDLNLTVKRGETFGFLGPNGAGKTTTIKLILNLIRAHSGTIKIFGTDSRETRARKSIGYLPEQPYFYDHLSVEELMRMYARLADVESSRIRDSVERALKRVGMTDRKKARMRSLSKGLTQRVAMAQAIVADPKLLILDEPFSGLDPIGRKELRDLIFELKKSGATVFMSSHILSDVEFLCERASITVKGHLKGIFDLKQISGSAGSTYEISVSGADAVRSRVEEITGSKFSGGELSRIHAGSMDIARKALQVILAEESCRLESFHTSHAGLEDIFVSLAGKQQEKAQ